MVGKLDAREGAERHTADPRVAAELDEVGAKRMGSGAGRPFGRWRPWPDAHWRRRGRESGAGPRRAVRPVEVLDHQQHRRAHAETAEHVQHQLVEARLTESSRRPGRRSLRGAQRGCEQGQLIAPRPEGVVKRVRLQLGGQVPQRSGNRRVRQLSIAHVDAAANEHEHTVALRLFGEVRDQLLLPTPASPPTRTVALCPPRARSTCGPGRRQLRLSGHHLRRRRRTAGTPT